MGCSASVDVPQTEHGEEHAPPQHTENPLEKPLKKYVMDYGALAMEHTQGLVVMYAFGGGIAFAFREGKSGAVHYRHYGEAELLAEKLNMEHSIASIIKSLASDVLKRRATLYVSGEKAILGMTIASKDIAKTYAFTVSMDVVGAVGRPASRDVMHRCILTPLVRMVQSKRTTPSTRDRDAQASTASAQVRVLRALNGAEQTALQCAAAEVNPLRLKAMEIMKGSTQLQSKLRKVEHMHRASTGACPQNPLDGVLAEGGARFFNHLPQASEHHPQPHTMATDLCRAIAAKVQKLPMPTTAFDLSPLDRLDEWDFNAFEMERVTDGNALMYTTYALLQRLDLIRILKLDDTVVRSFLSALQAGYHPNPYHNATHAADVAQVNYFIIRRGGLIEKCRLSHVTLLAAILAGAMHDFDHPGFNNNFHARTNAYLATLYNDRSVLENHHCACVFEMMQLPQYNILAPLSEEQYREARDTIIELVLATDMGNHNKIFTTFRQQLVEVSDWTKPDEYRAALSMALKVADTSNTARPQHLYLEWARNIANEFYNQGDYEQRMQLTVSPFMDRSKDAAEFPKGQMSFMKIVVQPMLEAMASLCPALKFTTDSCEANLTYWQRHIDDATS